MIKKFIYKIFVKLKLINGNRIYLNNSPLIRNIAKFIVNECVVGDYYEFGVYRGQTLISFYKTISKFADKRIKSGNIIGINEKANLKRMEISNEMTYHAFDSFQGLPELSSADLLSDDFTKGQYTSSISTILNLAKKYSVPEKFIKFHGGWFSKTCNKQYAKENSLKKASIIWLDCDLYSSAKDALNIFDSILQNGTIIVVDDWYNFKGHPKRGVQKAFNDWRFSEEISKKYIIHEYKKDSWSRNSFIVNLNDE
jgi:hypothetical protein